ncbi:MAG: hypothetical protein A2X11_11715 [Bacteroidetes bacterium GWE2_42_24]|nr:MAG: hypothetical protein A2X11_11715 [Bacteroidetes bacterium GWE2_42_24]OFY28265.1 MAG: hypothetical protein A2X09_11975 [Bacteroidetes bacterium GWF2_43_11]
MKKLLILAMAIIIISSCSTLKKTAGGDYGSPKVKQELKDDNTFRITLYSQDNTYGYTEKNPIMVGGNSEGPINERRFLNALSGPNGEKIEYYRMGSCCLFKTKNSAWGGMLDKYNITYTGLKKNLIIYINMYDSDTLKVPVGLKLRYVLNSQTMGTN